MKHLYDVRIEAQISKVITVEAASTSQAIEIAHEHVGVSHDHNTVRFEQETVEAKRVSPLEAREHVINALPQCSCGRRGEDVYCPDCVREQQYVEGANDE